MFLRKLLLTIGVRNPPKFHHKGTKQRCSTPTWGIRNRPQHQEACGITSGGVGEMAEKMGIEGLHSVSGEAVFAACLPIFLVLCPWAGSSVEL